MKTVLIGQLGTSLDNRGKGHKRWERWRPTLALCQQDDLIIDRMELLFDQQFLSLAQELRHDIQQISPETDIHFHILNLSDPWDFESVYANLHDFARNYRFQHDKENYLIHITTGTHVSQICLYLLTEAHYLPGRLIQSSPGKNKQLLPGSYQIIDLDLSRYDQIASRFAKEQDEAQSFLKSGIKTKNVAFNQLIEQLEQVAILSDAPILLTGPSGAGKSQLAKRIYQLKKQRGQIAGQFIEINCATLRGDQAMSTLFGHSKGAFTGAIHTRKGLLAEADQGILFLDEIAELGLDEQAMLLRAIEDKRFMPFGSDQESSSQFQLIAGSNKNLYQAVEKNTFREDLMARINLWTFELPSLRQRLEDLPANLEYELEKHTQKYGIRVNFNQSAKQDYLDFALSDQALWRGNFRDLNASITRMATFSRGGRITQQTVNDEIQRLKKHWQNQHNTSENQTRLEHWLTEPIDLFDQLQLSAVIKICQNSKSAAEAGRKLFNISRKHKNSVNDSHRIRQYLQKFKLDFPMLKNNKAKLS